MTNSNTILGYINLLRPRAKFIKYDHSSNFIESAEDIGSIFHYVNLYDEKIDSNVLRINDGEYILVDNTYLPSFAYNLFLCWIYPHYEQSLSSDEKNRLIRYNFKKFFGEQLLSHKNCIFSRAILLETLLYEQQLMVPIFKLRDTHQELDNKAKFAASMMSALVSNHELGHFYLAKFPALWDEIFEIYKDSLIDIYPELTTKFPAEFIEEIQCDVISITQCFKLFHEQFGKSYCLRAMIFAFSCFVILSSLDKSAKETLKNYKTDESVDFRSIKKIDHQFEYSYGVDEEFHQRSIFAQKFCNALAKQEDVDLYADKDDFLIQQSIIEDLFNEMQNTIDMVNENERAIALLVAESLHNHPEGMEYLYLRSKSFVTNRKDFDHKV